MPEEGARSTPTRDSQRLPGDAAWVAAGAGLDLIERLKNGEADSGLVGGAPAGSPRATDAANGVLPHQQHRGGGQVVGRSRAAG